MVGIKRPSSAQTNVSTRHVERWTCIVLALFTLLVNQLCAVQIISMSVPQWIQNGTSDEVLLDCEYDVSANDENLVIKWFLNDDPQPIYQWIPNLKQRAASPKFKDHLVVDNQEEASSNKDKYFRALRIRRPTTELTGMYRCEVYSLESQDSRASQMIVYAPPKKLHFFVTEAGPTEAVNVTCEAEGVFPLPQLRLYQLPPGGSQRIQLPGKKTLTNQSGVFDIRLISQLDDATEPMYFECELQINSTDYKQYERLQYVPEPENLRELGFYIGEPGYLKEFGFNSGEPGILGEFGFYSGVPITISVIEEETDGAVGLSSSTIGICLSGLLFILSHYIL